MTGVQTCALPISTQLTNVTVGVTGVNPVTIAVHNETLVIPIVNLVEDTSKSIEFFVTVSDADGVNDIDRKSVV